MFIYLFSFIKLGFHIVHGDMVSKIKNQNWNRYFSFSRIGFIDFEDQRDAADAVKGLDGK